jgi:hypothetical protein
MDGCEARMANWLPEASDRTVRPIDAGWLLAWMDHWGKNWAIHKTLLEFGEKEGEVDSD